MNRFKVAVMIQRLVTIGGAEKYAFEVSKWIVSQGHEIHLFACKWEPEAEKCFECHRVPAPPGGTPAFINNLSFNFVTHRLLWSGYFDIIHAYSRMTYADISTIQNACHRNAIASRKNYLVKMLARAKVAISPRELVHLAMERKQMKSGYGRRIIVASDRLRSDVMRNYGTPAESLRIAHSGVDVDSIFDTVSKEDRKGFRARLGISDEETVLLFVGTHFRRKGLDTLIKALSLSKWDSARLFVLGGGDIARYRKLARTLGIEHRISFEGLVRSTFQYYAAADLFVLPTLDAPCSPSSFEAMASGLPVIMSTRYYDGSAELVRDEALLLRNPLDEKELASAINSLRDPEARRRLANQGPSFSRTLTWDKPARVALDTYFEVKKEKALQSGDLT